ncbi:MAG: carboxymuconolactone decarboxylase family protein [Phycisphaerae bacterium]
MPRLPTVSLESATGPARELFDAVKHKLGGVPNMFRTMANSPAVLKAYLSFSGALAETSLAPKLREQIALAVAGVNHCDYCAAAHTALGKKAGLGEDETIANRQGRAADPKVEAALRFALAIAERRGEVTDAELSATRAAGYNDAQIAEIVAAVALNLFTNYFNNVAQTEIDFPRARELAASH